MQKLNQIWEGFLKLESMLIIKLWVIVWIPLCFIFGTPLFTSTDIFTSDHTYMGNVRILFSFVLCGYFLYLPVIADMFRMNVLKRRKLKQQ